jgi:hypothetical protein
VLDREAGDMAVRLALGETQLIAENKDYFRREGVDLDALTVSYMIYQKTHFPHGECETHHGKRITVVHLVL